MDKLRSANPLGVHALVWVGDTSPKSLEYAVEQTSGAGFDLLELSLHDLANLDVKGARTALEERGLEVVCSRGLAFDADVSSEDLSIVRKGETLLQESLDVTGRLGGRLLTGALFSALGKYPRPVSAAGWANAVGVLKNLARDAGKRNMRLGLEVCNRYETNVANTARTALRMCDEIGEDNVGVHLDTYHMNIEEDDFVRPVHNVGERLEYVHIGENHRGYLGSGHIDFTAFFHALGDIGYAGAITFESFSSTVVARQLSDDLGIWRDLWSDGMDLAVQARTFIRQLLHAGMPGARNEQ